MRIVGIILVCLGMLVVGHVMRAPYEGLYITIDDHSNYGWLAPDHITRWSDRPNTNAGWNDPKLGWIMPNIDNSRPLCIGDDLKPWRDDCVVPQ